MELALTIIAGLGVLLFIVSFLSYVVSGFKHHFVTGIISALPVLNIVTLASLWDKNKGKFIVGMVGLVIASVAWFMGANKGLQNIMSRQAKNSSETVILSAEPKQKESTRISAVTEVPVTTFNSTETNVNRSRSFDESKMLGLPSKALYTMSFDIVPVDQINTLQGRIVQITKTNNEMVEGRIKTISQGSVIVDGSLETELPIASIKQLKLMVKKANK